MSDLKRRVTALERQRADKQEQPAYHGMIDRMAPLFREMNATRQDRPSVITQDELKVMIEYLNENRRREIEGLPPLESQLPKIDQWLQRIKQRDEQQQG